MYPKTNTRLTSIMGTLVKKRNFFRTKALKIPKNRPMVIEKKPRRMKPYSTLKGVEDVNSELGPAYSYTVLNKMMQTASLVMPSPKINEKSLGYASYLTMEIAATASVHISSEHINIISIKESVKGS
jgi:hypothetical protein